MRNLRGTLAGLAVIVQAGLPVAASEGGGAAQALITPQIGTIFWTLVTFVLMVILLGRFAWRPLLGALEARERSIQETLDHARSDRGRAQELLEQHQQLLNEARRERSAAMEQGRQEAERLRAEILEQARRQREQLLAQTEAQVQAGLRQAREELRSATADLAIRAAEKLLARNLDQAAHRRLVEEHLADLEKNSAPS
jgi:F-type H+-transporting ATPase subunit b